MTLVKSADEIPSPASIFLNIFLPIILSKSDGEINFSSSSDNIINLVRALTKPYPGATCSFEGQDIIIWSIEKGKNQNKNIEPGKVLSVNKQSIEVKTGDFSVILVDHEFSTIPKLNQYIK